MGHIMPADPHRPQVGNLQISANAKTLGKQATRQHDRNRKHVRYRLALCGEMVSSIALSALLGRRLPNRAERQRLSAKGARKPGLKVDDVGPLRGHPYPR